MHFPKNWLNDRPPPEAVDAEGSVFRLVKNSPPCESDLATHWETGRLKNAPECLRCGLSVFREIRDAVHQRRLMPKLGPWIARATLAPEHGKTKLTTGQQPTHTTWWSYEGVGRVALFSVVAEVR